MLDQFKQHFYFIFQLLAFFSKKQYFPLLFSFGAKKWTGLTELIEAITL